MTKNVLVQITSLHQGESDEDSIQSVVQGTYEFTENQHVVSYEEILEESFDSEPATSTCILKIAKDRICLTKHGHTETEMFFKRGESYDSFYETPVGSLQMCLRTSHLSIEETQDHLSVDLEYGLELNCSHISDCHLKIDITSK